MPESTSTPNELRARPGERLGEAAPAPMQAFAELRAAAAADGVPSTRVKELIALAIAVSARCDGCIAHHVHDALAAGASRRQIAGTIHAVLTGGGPAVAAAGTRTSALGT